MADYKELYLKMLRASEQAINLLILAQRECEALYAAAPPPELKILIPPEDQRGKEGPDS